MITSRNSKVQSFLATKPRWLLWAIVAVLAVGAVCLGIALGAVFASVNLSRPVWAQPWYFWTLLLFMFLTRYLLITIDLPYRPKASLSEMSLGAALLRVAGVTLLVFVTAVGEVNGIGLFLTALWLPTGIIGAGALVQRWRVRGKRFTSAH